ncbi:MAG: AMP-binding protein [Alphaproteobacteria bacterium]|nr:AMP-binding protein [Alphaproteobacteria bacterium]
MPPDPIFPERRLETLTETGLWGDELIIDHLDRVAAQRPDNIAVVDHNSATGRRTEVSFRRLQELSKRAAAGLMAYGIGPGDVVAVQLPSWWHYFVLYPACARIGAVINPLMPIFRERELKFMLGLPRTKLIVAPRSFRGFDYPAMIDGLRPELPDLAHMLVVMGDDPTTSFERNLLECAEADEADLLARRPGANEVTEVMYTSGTTGQPKGVMHTPNTLLCKARLARELFDLDQNDAIFMGSPLAHQTGFLYGSVMSMINGLKCVLQDIWEPVAAAEMIAAEKCTITLGSTPFVSDLVYTPGVREHDISSLRLFLCAGAPIPSVLLHDAAEVHPNLYVMSAWGMTENGIVTATYPGDSPEKVFETDGRAIPHQEVRVVGEDGQVLPANQEGRLQARGPTTFVGYFQRPEAYDIDDDLWFETGDLARMDTEGYIRITGRSKDIIIRGGENIPVVEIEALLYRHPAIRDAAIIGVPDPRLGERGCAVVQLHDGATMTLAALTEFLREFRLAKNYLPERLEVVAEFPRTPSGKIQKFKLREMLVEDMQV